MSNKVECTDCGKVSSRTGLFNQCKECLELKCTKCVDRTDDEIRQHFNAAKKFDFEAAARFNINGLRPPFTLRFICLECYNEAMVQHGLIAESSDSGSDEDYSV